MIRNVLFTAKTDKSAFVILSIVIVTIISDVSISKIAVFTDKSNYDVKISVFAAIFLVCVIGQFLILEFLRHKNKESGIKRKLPLDKLHASITITQCILIGIIICAIVQMSVISSYSTLLLILTVVMSYGLAITAMLLLARHLFAWLESRSNVILFYGISSVAFGINVTLTLILMTTILLDKPADVRPHVTPTVPSLIPGSGMAMLSYYSYNAYVAFSIISFLVIWIATALLLRHYFKGIRYFLLLSAPLVYFLSQFVTLNLNIFAPLLESEPVSSTIMLTLIFSFIKPVGGILFGIAFWSMAKTVAHSPAVRSYMTVAGFGLVLFFISNQGIVLISAPYPPFGLIATSLTGFSSYLIFVGIYYSAISVAQDNRLRQSIRKLAAKELQFLDRIGSAEMSREIRNKVVTLTRQHQSTLIEETGVQSSVDEEQMRQYLDEVLNEINNSRRKERIDRG
jgi:hypothetical protein